MNERAWNIAMDRERKKRRKYKDEEGEDAKIDKFFSLIRSTREIRDHRYEMEGSREKDVLDDQKRPSSEIWKPSFKPEDFGLEDAVSKDDYTEGVAGPSRRGRQTGDGSSKDIGLNLELSL